MKTPRQAGNVQRYHTTRLIHSENVAQHSWNVVNTVLALTNGQASRALILAAHLHDAGEVATGDIPSPVKKALGLKRKDWDDLEDAAVQAMFPYLQGLDLITEQEAHILKVADNMDGLAKCLEELRMFMRTYTRAAK